MDGRKTADVTLAALAGRVQGIAARAGTLTGRLTRRLGLSLALLAVICTGTLVQFAAAGLGLAPAALARGVGAASHAPNTYARFRTTGNASGAQLGQPPQLPVKRAPITGKGLQVAHGPSSTGSVMTHPVSVPLDSRLLADGSGTVGAAGAPVYWFKSSDSMLEIGIPAHSIDLSVALQSAYAAARHTGKLVLSSPYTLVFAQTQGGFFGQSIILGEFTISVRDSAGRTLSGVQLVAPLSVRLHYAAPDLADVNAASLQLSWAITADVAHHVAAQAVPVMADYTAHTLSASIGTLHDGTLILSGAPADASTPTIEHLMMDGNQGDLSFTLPLAVPPAAGGVTPPLQLVYSSAGPNGRHAATAPAPWVGDGWDLSLGSITYDTTTHLYYLNGIGGVSEPLVCCMTDQQGTHYFVPHHHPNVRVFTADNDTNPSPINTDASCFIVHTPDGYEYRLGCTNDSRRVMIQNGADIATEWDVDNVGRRGASGYLQQYSAHYWQDYVFNGPTNYNTRDAGLAAIDYDFVNGTVLGRILFNVHCQNCPGSLDGAASTGYGTRTCSGAPGSTPLRCDDPVQLTDAGGQWEATPQVMSTITLDNIQMQIKLSSTFQTVREYDFTYADSTFTKCYDQFTGQGIACAGEHLLRTIQEIPYQMVSGTDTKEFGPQPIEFQYTQLKNEYHDSTVLPTNNVSAPYDAQTYWQYLSQITDEETGFTEAVSWEAAYGNSHGVPSGSVDDPTTCDTVNCFANSNSNTWPDDRQWPRRVVASITDQGSDSTAGPVTTTYQYSLPQPCPNFSCTEDYWIPPNGFGACDSLNPPIAPGSSMPACLMGSFSNYYDEVYTGFGTVQTNHPDGSATQDVYFAGDGWGSDDWLDGNRLQGMLYTTTTFTSGGAKLVAAEQDYSDGTGTYCPTVSGNNQLFETPYLMCEVFELKRITYSWEQQTGQPPNLTQTWTYDHDSTPANTPTTDYNHFYEQPISTAVTSDNMLWDSYTPSSYGSSSPTFTTSYTDVYRDGQVESPKTSYYLLNLPEKTTLTDSSSAGTQWTCTQTSYDGQGFVTGGGQETGLTSGLATRTDAFSDGVCGSANVSTAGAGYDAYGQPVVKTDADAIAGVSGHLAACVPGTAPVEVYPTGVSTYSSCTTYDTTYQTYPTAGADALNHTTTTAYDFLQGVPTQTTDPNTAVTTSTGPMYEYSGTPSASTYLDTYVGTQLPQLAGESQSWTKRVYTYSFCAAAAPAPGNTTPCYEVDTVQQLDTNNSGNILVSRQIYDRDGRLVETRVTGPTAGQDVVTFTQYDDPHDKTWQSDPCTVASLTAAPGVGAQSQSTTNYIAPVLNSAGTGTSAYVSPASVCSGLTGTTTYTDPLGRTVATDDALGTGLPANGNPGTGCLLNGVNHTTCTTYTIVMGTTLQSGDTEPFVATTMVDGDNHQSAVYKDAQGRVAYTQEFTGKSQTPGSGFTSYAIMAYTYDPLGDARAVKISLSGSAAGPWTIMSTATYDALKRMTSAADADLGTLTYTYDQNGNLLTSHDPLGETVSYTYDGLNRELTRGVQQAPNPDNVTYSYDQSGHGASIGRLTSENFSTDADGTLMSGSYSYTYDPRGEVTQFGETVDSTGNYTLGYTYDDAGLPTSLTYPDGEVMNLSYGSTGWLSLVTTQPSGGSTTTLLSGIGYTGDAGGLAGNINSASVGSGTYTYAASYDLDRRLTSTSLALTTPNTPFFSSSRTYDGAGNVTAVATALPAGTDNQVFCYDEQNRLVWAGSFGTPSCGTPLSPGTLTAAQYTQGFSYDALNRLTRSPLGPYTYGVGMENAGQTPLDAAQYIGTAGQLTPQPGVPAGTGTGPGSRPEAGSRTSSTVRANAPALPPPAPPPPGSAPPYSASYNANGEMTCRSTSTTASQSCYGGNTGGAQMSYDAEGQLVHWQNAPGTSPTSTVNTLYDGEGNRVEQQVGQYSCGQACGMTYTTTQYVAGGIEEVAQQGGTSPSTTTTKYYSAGGLLVGVRVNGTLSYLTSDGLGSVSAALSSSGSLTAAQLFSPYGGVRYSSGTMPTARGFTGQYSDVAITGLMDYGARFYDPVAGQFTTADLVQGPNRYGYVAGNPTTWTDPSGQRAAECEDDCGSPGDGLPPGGVGPGGDNVSNGQDPADPTNLTGCDAECQLARVDAQYGLPADPPPATLDDTGAINSLDQGLDNLEAMGQEAGQLHAALQDEDVQMQADENEPRTAANLHAQETGDGQPPTTTDTETGKGPGTGATGNGTPTGPSGPSGPTEPPTTGGENGGGGGNGGNGGSGGSGNPLAGTQYTPKVYGQMSQGPGEFHSFPELVTNYWEDGNVFTRVSGDGTIKTWVEIPGGYLTRSGTWVDGVFQFIIEPDGVTINHRFFAVQP